MKKCSTVLFLFVLAVCGATGAFAQSESDFKITVENGAVTINRYRGNEPDAVIPATIEGLPVTAIGDWAFYKLEGLTSISIPGSVAGIGSFAFYGCTGLTTVSIPEGVTGIGNAAFNGCSGLTTVSISASVTGIGSYTTHGDAFSRCTALTTILVDGNNTTYSSRDGALFNKTGDTLIRCPAGLKGLYAIPPDVTGIADGAFWGCTGLTAVSIPASITGIGESAFAACTNLTSILVDTNNNHYTIQNSVLFNKTGDTLVAYPAGLNGQYAIPEGVTTIEAGAFSGCSGLRSVSMPASVTRIADGTFAGCTGLITEQGWFTVITLGGKGGRVLITGYTGPDAIVVIPDRIQGFPVTNIERSAFYDSFPLTALNISANVTDIGAAAFFKCTRLTLISIGANVNLKSGYDDSEYDSFPNGFDAYYNANGKKWGLYTYRNDAWSYERR